MTPIRGPGYHAPMLRKVSLSAMAFTYLFAGGAHFLRFDYFLSLQPDFMPAPAVMVRLSGLTFLLLGSLLAWPPARKAACSFIMFFWALGIPLNLYILSTGGAGIPLSREVLWARIPFHLGLIAWAWWHRIPERKERKALDRGEA
jgi:uncharacterized membrane protein